MQPADRAGDPAVDLSSDQHEQVRRRYRSYAPDYDRAYRRYSRASRELVLDAVRTTGAAAPSRIVDVCCGTGTVTGALAHAFPEAQIVGVDLSPDMLARARSALRGHLPAVHFFEATAESLPVETASADLVICANAFHLVEAQPAAMAELARVLAPGGRLVLLDWNADRPQMRLLGAWLNATQAARRRILRPRELAALARDEGLVIERLVPVRIRPLWGLMTLVARRA